MNEPQFDTLEEMIVATAAAVRPPERMTVSEAAEKYRWLNNPGSYVGPWSNDKTPYLIEPMNELTNLEFTGEAFVGPARTGKGLCLNTRIPTPNGWTTMRDIAIGSKVFGRDGKPCTVVAVSPNHNRKCYKIVFDDGAEIVTDDVHKWEVDNVISENTKVLETRALAENYMRGNRKRYAVRTCNVVQYPKAEQFLDPYILGVWLGDGSTMYGHITVGARDRQETKVEIEKRGFQVREYHPNGNKTAFTFGLRSDDGVPLIQHLATMRLGGQHGKFIPPEYIFADEHQRRELIRGLMDTDGSLFGKAGRTVQFGNANKQLVKDIVSILLSLGIKVRTRTRPIVIDGKQYSDCHMADFTTYRPEDIFSMPRKIATASRGDVRKTRTGQTTRRFISEIIEIDSVPTKCIQVDSPDHLFLATEHYIPTHNSDMFFNWLTYTAICDPADMMSVDMTQNTARDWSKGDLRKMLRHSKEVGKRIKPGRQNQNVHDIDFMSGMRLLVKWPVISELSGKTIPRLWIRDYDRMTQNVDGEGNPFDLTRKRAQTFGRYGMCVAEASPGFPVQNAKWIPSSPHEAPPCEGLLSIYNRGDRRRWFWRCMQCDDPFEAQFKHFEWPDTLDFMEASEQAKLVCPSCGFPHTHDMKHELNMKGKWIKEGQTWMPDGSVEGIPRRSDIASFWLMGPAAAFASWQQIVFKYLQASDEYERTGSEESLKTTVNVDQGLPYTPKAIEAGRLPEELKDRAEDWGGSIDNPVVPEGVRFIVKTADVQVRSFVIQTHGVFANGDVALIQMKKLRKSVLLDDKGEWQPIDPAARPEDWDVLIDEINETYPLDDGSGRRMRVKIMGCDSGGKDGVTANAYEFWRRLRKRGDDLSVRFHLMKGDGTKTAPRLTVSYPDSQRKDRNAGARGDIPVLRINANDVKDQLSAMLGRDFPGGMVRFPHWAEDWLYSQLTTEIRTAKGWENPSRKRNEAWDLLVYALALLLHRSIRFGFIDWSSPPTWAEEWDQNSMVVEANGNLAVEEQETLTVEQLAEQLG